MPVQQPAARVARLPVMVGVAGLHLACYLAVTRINAGREPADFWQLATPLDMLLPHLPGTWPFYWLTYPFVILGSGAALWRADHLRWRDGVVALVGVTLVGAMIQLLLPAVAPWPANPGPVMRAYHEGGLVLPYANLPSMHVTYAVLAAGLLHGVFTSRWLRHGATAIAAAITISTVTLKEHFVLDAVAGATLALAATWWWRRRARRAGGGTA